ncbi:unnamed protein product [Lepeophtheirus salmonis]|uniref:(salmon louse) hypothetical protein n=1 Tax=Lepeophtheirus salmonis TaxID=72036 RepID=A0A7R8CZ15_LEPSM|nr:unnamed protein product [Lepeophtheirus salmonis]CAF2973093.1 unnamed protein product [Lepeophtheirus salmonis]
MASKLFKDASFVFLMVWIGVLKIGESMEISSERGERLIFNIVKFQNLPCGTTTNTGTCYTADECASRGGTAGGACASGYGTCCMFTADCGGTITENSTLLEISSRTTDCTYTICRCSDNVCRIRLDFMVNFFVLSGPTVSTDGANQGDCNTDSFSLTSSQGASPVICGFNSGQHIIVEADQGCNTALFNIDGGSTMVTRMWNINVTQFLCGDEFGGPPGCLQFFTSNTGVVKSFNYNTVATSNHLSNQDYNVCFRRQEGNCRICYSSFKVGIKQTFGLSKSTNKLTASGVDTDCTEDFIEIPGATQVTIKKVTKIVVSVNKNCGRFLDTNRLKTLPQTICSFSVPFRFRFKTDANEFIQVGKGPDLNEAKGDPSGLLGFKLFFEQKACV